MTLKGTSGDFKKDLKGDLLSSSGPGLVQVWFDSLELDIEVGRLVIYRMVNLKFHKFLGASAILMPQKLYTPFIRY